MTLRFLLDTNTISEPLRPRPDRALMERLRLYRSHCAIAAPVWHELLYGMELLPPSKRRREIEDYLLSAVLGSFPILPFDERAAEYFGRERARLRRSGYVASFVDGEIASIAQVHGLTLVTSNRRDFERFSGLDVVDWKGPRSDI